MKTKTITRKSEPEIAMMADTREIQISNLAAQIYKLQQQIAWRERAIRDHKDALLPLVKIGHTYSGRFKICKWSVKKSFLQFWRAAYEALTVDKLPKVNARWKL